MTMRRCLIVAWMCSVMGYAQDDFYFRTHPHNESVKTGEHFRLECSVSSGDRILLAWTLNKESVRNTARRYQESSSSALVVRRADHRLDSGLFECSATNVSSGFSIASLPATVSVQWLENSTRIEGTLSSSGLSFSDRADVDSGQSISLTCKINGSAGIQWQWSRNGDVIDAASSATLRLDAVGASDAGTYTCAARNAAAAASVHLPLVLCVTATQRLVDFSARVVAVRSEAASLVCSVSGATAAVQWFFRGTALANSSQYVIENDGKLVIAEVKQQNEGWYLCRIPMADASYQEYAAHLIVAFLEEFVASSVDPAPQRTADGIHFYYFGEHSTVEVTCLAPEGLPWPLVWWQGPEGAEMLTDGSGAGQSILSMTRIRRQDAGVYRCLAQNAFGTRSIPVNITVTTPPVIEQHPQDITVDEGQQVALNCSYDGLPSPLTSITWMKDQRRLPAGPAPAQGVRHSTLTLTASADRAGSYVCLCQTVGNVPVASRTAVLQVRSRLKFTQSPVNKKLELGASSKVHCRADGSPRPEVHWVKQGQTRSNNGTLYFRRVQQDDSGYYTCVANNSQGSINVTVFLDVIVMPHFTMLPGNVTLSKEGHSVEFHCRAEGRPLPAIQWDKDSVLNGFPFDRFSVSGNGTLRIQDVRAEDEGNYGCTAGNAGGFKRAEFRLLVQGWEYQSDHNRESITKTIVITLGAAGAYILLSVALLIWCRIKRHQRKMNPQPPPPPTPDTNGHPSPQTALLSKGEQSERAGDQLNVPSAAFSRGSLLGKGRFGDIYEGQLRQGAGATENVAQRVLIRTLSTRDEECRTEFRRQMDMFQRVHHINLAALTAICYDPEPAQIAIDYPENFSNLKMFLKRQSLTPMQRKSAVIQIARAMDSLAAARYVHRDLGARNIIIHVHNDAEMSLKITHLGLDAQEPFLGDYCRHRHQLIPLRWLPHEAVFDDEYSTKSDVWMFACTVWELYHSAGRPFECHSDDDLLVALRVKTLTWTGTLTAPTGTLTALLEQCWSHDPALRPSFQQILNAVQCD